jgi:hypothetical protein
MPACNKLKIPADNVSLQNTNFLQVWLGIRIYEFRVLTLKKEKASGIFMVFFIFKKMNVFSGWLEALFVL